MRITHIVNSPECGGAQTFVASLAALQNTQPDVEAQVVFLRDDPGGLTVCAMLRESGVAWTTLSARQHRSIADVGILCKLRRVIAQSDIVHVHLFPALYLVALAACGLAVPLVYTEHSTTNRRRSRRWLRLPERLVYGRYARICAVSNDAAHSLVEWLSGEGKTPGKWRRGISTVENGVDLRRFQGPAPVNPGRLFGREGKAVLMVSRFSGAKDHATLIRALHHLPDEYFAVFVGVGPTLRECRRLAADEGVAPRCLFLGARSDIPDLMKVADVGVQSSRHEGFALTVVEMMAAGLPVVATDLPGLRNTVGDAGLLFSCGDAVDLAYRIMGADERRNDLITRGRKRASRFSISRPAAEYLAIYRNSISNS